MAWVAGEAPRERRGAGARQRDRAPRSSASQLGPVVGARGARRRARGRVLLDGACSASRSAVWAWTQPVREPRPRRSPTPAEALRNRAMLAGHVADRAAGGWRSACSTSSRRCASTRSAPPRSRSALTFFAAAGRRGDRHARWSAAYTDRARRRCRSCASALVATVAALIVVQLPASRGRAGDRRRSGCPACSASLWVPAMGLLAGGAERIGLDHGFAFAYFNLAWAAGFTHRRVAGGSARRGHHGRGRVLGRRRPVRGLGRCTPSPAAAGAAARRERRARRS